MISTAIANQNLGVFREHQNLSFLCVLDNRLFVSRHPSDPTLVMDIVRRSLLSCSGSYDLRLLEELDYTVLKNEKAPAIFRKTLQDVNCPAFSNLPVSIENQKALIAMAPRNQYHPALETLSSVLSSEEPELNEKLMGVIKEHHFKIEFLKCLANLKGPLILRQILEFFSAFAENNLHGIFVEVADFEVFCDEFNRCPNKSVEFWVAYWPLFYKQFGLDYIKQSDRNFMCLLTEVIAQKGPSHCKVLNAVGRNWSNENHSNLFFEISKDHLEIINSLDPFAIDFLRRSGSPLACFSLLTLSKSELSNAGKWAQAAELEDVEVIKEMAQIRQFFEEPDPSIRELFRNRRFYSWQKFAILEEGVLRNSNFRLLGQLPISVSFETMKALTCIEEASLSLESLALFYRERILDSMFWAKIDAMENYSEAIVALHLAYQTNSFEDTRSGILKTIDVLQLPSSGEKLPREEFERHPLFKYTQEKSVAFSDIWLMTQRPSIEAEYAEFLVDLKSQTWFEVINLSKCRLAILAFFNGDIDREELFVIHTAFYALREERSARCFILQTKDVAAYLGEAGFSPFSPNTQEYILRHRKEDLSAVKEAIVRMFDTRSVVKRTVIEYNLPKPDFQGSYFSVSVESDIYKKLGFKLGLKGDNTVVLLPPEFSIELLVRTCSHAVSSPRDHFYSFGYSALNGGPFYKGLRSISIPSPFFALPYPHNYAVGCPGLGMLMHDINYHMALDINMPDARLITNIAKNFAIRRSKSPIILAQTSSLYQKMSQKFAEHLVDREAGDYTKDISNKDAFWIYVNRIARFTGVILGFSKEGEQAWLNEIGIPVIAETLLENGRADLMEPGGSLSPLFIKMCQAREGQ